MEYGILGYASEHHGHPCFSEQAKSIHSSGQRSSTKEMKKELQAARGFSLLL